jgi:hypothetical protein
VKHIQRNLDSSFPWGPLIRNFEYGKMMDAGACMMYRICSGTLEIE